MATRQVIFALVISAGLWAFQADNTARNKGDREGAAITAEKQGNNKADIKMVAQIRKAIVRDKTLSTNARNVKIVVNDGSVWLRGPVSSEAEKDRVLALARQLAGEKNVTSFVEVTKEKEKSK